jgi:thiol-disulfide isomerase/thioredoxin
MKVILAILALHGSLVMGFQTADDAAGIDAVVDHICRQFEAIFDTEFDHESVAVKARTIVEGLDLHSLRGVHVGRLLAHGYMIERAGIRDDLLARLPCFLDDDGPDGATAAVHLLRERMKAANDVEERARIYRETFRHPGLEAAIEARAIEDLLGFTDPGDPELLSAVLPDLLALERLLVPDLAPNLALQFHAYFETLQKAAEAGHEIDLQRYRARMAELAAAELERAEHPGHRDMLKDIVSFLSGAAARGELLDHPAPPMAFLWSSREGLSSLDDLKGCVVVLEFWATWCGPCIAALPKTCELQQHYDGFAVTILGATKLYGGVLTADREWVSAEKPQEEFALMAEYIERQNITWPIVFCKAHVEGEFGILGIPSIAIIDAAGVVRHVGLHPAQPREELMSRVDALLKEAGLPTPDSD